jgi:hypothetical protein
MIDGPSVEFGLSLSRYFITVGRDARLEEFSSANPALIQIDSKVRTLSHRALGVLAGGDLGRKNLK